MSGFHPTEWQYRHRRAGRVIWASGVGEIDIPEIGPDFDALLREQEFTPNALADEGENAMLDVFFRAGTAPSNFYIALYNDTPVDTDTLATLTGEPSGSGYARSLVERNSTGWPTLALDSGDYRAVSSTETFTASGGTIGPVTYACLVTAASGTSGLLIAYNALSASRTLNDGDSLDVTFRVKLA
jgi:hypothetical protein